jgi:multidrug efflux pump
MNLSAPFVRRPIGTTLLTAGLMLAGIAAFFALPVSPLPQVDFPTVSVTASLPGGSPETMATSVAIPLERHLGVISDVIEMTSQSKTGQTQITLQFNLNRDIDGAARDVQAAINAARVDLPATLRSNPTYRKVNPADAPIMILALTSKTKTPGQIYDEVSNLIQQHLLQVSGVGDVELGGASLPAVRVEIAPYSLSQYGIGLEDVRAALNAANPNRPKGVIENDALRYQIYTNDNGRAAAQYRDLVVAWRNGAAVRLRDIANVIDSVEDIRTVGLFNGQPAVIVILTRQPNANIIQTVDAVKRLLPQLQSELPPDVTLSVASDRTITIRASLHEVETTLLIALILVIVVVSLFLSSARASLIPAVAVVSSLMGTLGVMYFAGFSLNNLSLMALTVATGFVVDDAIVVLENASRYVEAGMPRMQAALRGAREVGFTVVSISISLVAVFIPLLFMGGIVGRLFREFAVTLSAAVLISLVISLTTTAMMCAFVLKPDAPARPPGRLARWARAAFDRVLATYGHSLDWALDHAPMMVLLLVGVIALNIYLYIIVPKGFFPQQDTGQLNGGMRADQSISFQAMQGKLEQIVDIVRRDPAVATVVGFTGGTRAGGGFMFMTLKPRAQARGGSQAVIQRLRPQLEQITGLRLFLNPVQDMQIGGRQANASFQYTLQSDSITELRRWATRLAEQVKQEPALTDIDTDQEDHGIESFVTIDRASAARLGVAARDIDNALYDAYGQRQVSTIYTALNQYHVIMEVDPRYAQTPSALNDIYVPAHGLYTPTAAAATTGKGLGLSGSISSGVTYGASSTGSTATTSSGGGAGSGGGAAMGAAGTVSVGGSGGASAAISSPSTPSASPSSSSTSSSSSSGSGSGSSSSSTTSGASSAPPVSAGTPLSIKAGGSGGVGSGGGGGGASSSAASAASTPSAPARPVVPSRDPSTGSEVSTSAATMVPLAAIAGFANSSAPSSINHQNTSLATTIAFNLAPGASLSDAAAAFTDAANEIRMPATVRGGFQGTARTFQTSLGDEPMLIGAALLAIYIILGILYESYVHPLTVLSTLPSAGVGAVLALLLFNMEFSIIALIGVILLIGIVKKNAILIIDFALDAERTRGLSPRAAIREAAMLRFRPILMTTLAAALGALPLAIGFGEGAELRRPLGISIIGGLLVSQVLPLLTTPVVYLYMDKLRGRRAPARHPDHPSGDAPPQLAGS